MNTWSEWLDNTAQAIAKDSALGTAFKAVIALTVAILLWFVFKALMHTLKKRLEKAGRTSIDDQLFRAVRNGLAYGLILGCGSYLIRLFQLHWIERFFPALMMVLFAGPVSRFLLILLNQLEQRWADKTETIVDNIVFDLLNKFSGAIIYIMAVILALDFLGINVMPFVAGAGVLGVAVGFAAKDTLSNLIAGILLIIDRPFEIGDRIEVWSAPAGSATWGDVIDIGLRATKIKTTDHIIIVIPNNEIMKRDIVNYTLISSKIRVRINIGVAYDTDIEHAKKVILKAASEIEWIAQAPPPKVVVRNFGESSVDLQLRVWIEDARKRMDTISTVTDRVKAIFDAEGIEIPYPKRDVHIITHSSAVIEKQGLTSNVGHRPSNA